MGMTAFALTGGLTLVKIFSNGRHDDFFIARPPGADLNGKFEAACIRCGKCKAACPYDSIIMSEGENGISVGTPYLNLRQKPCYLCSGLPCVKVCPTTALDHELVDTKNVRIGTAAITDREACLALKGLRCEVCHRVCPLIDKAIVVEKRVNPRTGVHVIFEPVVHKDKCVGCGICEHACVLDRPAIVVMADMRGDKSRHYLEMK
jgi:ferredoxin-type protein NapG